LATEIEEASSGFEVPKSIRKQRPDAIFLDLVMPGISGFETLRQLKLDPDHADIPVIVHTSKALDPSEREEILRYAVDILPKMSSSREESQAALTASLAKAGVAKVVPQER
jgi:CheY-like chemotaxis protein